MFNSIIFNFLNVIIQFLDVENIIIVYEEGNVGKLIMDLWKDLEIIEIDDDVNWF